MSSEGYEHDVGRMLGRLAKKERDDLDRDAGEYILAVLAAEEARRQEDPLVKALIQAHQVKASEADDKQ